MAQTLVEGYYAMLGGVPTTSSLVVCLTNIEVSHFFLLKTPATRDREERRHLEVVWHNAIFIDAYPPRRQEEVFPFVEFVHEVLDCQL